MSQNLSSVAVVLGVLRVNHTTTVYKGSQKNMLNFLITMVVEESFLCLMFSCFICHFSIWGPGSGVGLVCIDS